MRMKILIVDDQKHARHSIRALLSTLLPAFEFSEAENGEQAIWLIEKDQPDIVVMDMRMPVIDGITATRVIKSRWPGIKIVLMSMYGDQQVEARQAGADAYLTKVEPPEVLLSTLDRLLFARENQDKANGGG
jgi:CheY-like chemotaxis protein